jgi:coenzyme PQQ synthesis protein D (PqqD)
VITLTSQVQIDEEVLIQELDDKAVLFSLKSGTYFELNAVGARVWYLLAVRKQLADVQQVIVAEYDVTEEGSLTDLLSLVNDLARHDLVKIS